MIDALVRTLMVLYCTLGRSDLAWRKGFADAGLKVIHEQVQKGFPEGLYPVKMYVRPMRSKACYLGTYSA